MAAAAYTPSRRAMLGMIATTPLIATVAAVPALVIAHDPIPAAWAACKAAIHDFEATDAEADYAEVWHPIGVRMDEADETLMEGRALSPGSVAMKLRRAFTRVNESAWAQRLAFGEDDADLREQLRLSDMLERLVWGAIEDLERMELR